MDFLVGLSTTLGKFDTIFEIGVDLTKSMNFIPMKVTYYAKMTAKIYIRDLVLLHGVCIYYFL